MECTLPSELLVLRSQIAECVGELRDTGRDKDMYHHHHGKSSLGFPGKGLGRMEAELREEKLWALVTPVWTLKTILAGG